MLKRFHILVALATAFAGVPSAQAQREAATYASQADAIPFELFRGTRIFFEGRINGQSAWMMLDSGASSTVLNRGFAERIGIRQGRAITARGIGGTEQGSVAEGVSIEVGPLHIGGTNLLVLDLGPTERQIGRPIDVILGMEAFRAGILDIDFPGRRIRFAPSAGFAPPPDAIAVPISQAQGRRTIPVSVNGGPPFPADLDIGHGGALMLSRDYVQRNPDIATLPFAPTTAGGVGGRVPKHLVSLPTVSIAGHTFRGVSTTLSLGADDIPVTGGNIGIDLLQRFRLIFHYGRGTLFLVPNAAALAEPMPKNRLGLRLVLAEDRLRVDEVIPGSPGAEAGWRAGDEIVTVNGTPVDGRFWYRDDSRFTTMPAGTLLDLVRADGTRQPVTLRDFY